MGHGRVQRGLTALTWLDFRFWYARARWPPAVPISMMQGASQCIFDALASQFSSHGTVVGDCVVCIPRTPFASDITKDIVGCRAYALFGLWERSTCIAHSPAAVCICSLSFQEATTRQKSQIHFEYRKKQCD
jgi:hypothetical protein